MKKNKYKKKKDREKDRKEQPKRKIIKVGWKKWKKSKQK